MDKKKQRKFDATHKRFMSLVLDFILDGFERNGSLDTTYITAVLIAMGEVAALCSTSLFADDMTPEIVNGFVEGYLNSVSRKCRELGIPLSFSTEAMRISVIRDSRVH